MAWMILVWTVVLIGWTIGLVLLHQKTSAVAKVADVVSAMTAVDMQKAMFAWNQSMEVYAIIQRYVYMPSARGKNGPS